MSDDRGYIPLWGLILSGIGMTILTTLAIVGNILVIASYFRDKRLQNVHNVYIVHLAVADLFIGGISMLFYVHFTLANKVWVFGRALCKVWCLNDFSVCLQTVLLLMLLSLDRVLLLRTGAQYVVHETKKRAVTKCFIAWIFALGIYGPAVIFWDVVRGYSVVEYDDCEAEFVTNVTFGITSSVCELLIPCVTLTTLNVMVFLLLRKRLNRFRTKSRIGPSKQSTGIFTIPNGDVIGGSNSVRMGQTETENIHVKSARKDVKAARYLAVLVIAFIICWGPYTICTLVDVVCEDCVNVHLYEFVTWLLWAKSAINPLLYASQSTLFKANFKNILPFLSWCAGK